MLAPRDQSYQDVQPASLVRLHPVLECLRFAMLTCRAQARIDTFQACAALHTVPLDGYGALLLRVLSSEMREPPTFFAPGRSNLSFDEEWILRILDRIDDGDADSIYFLLASRVSRTKCRTVATLFHALSRIGSE